MTARTRLFVLSVLTTALAALAWSLVGSVSVASAQKDGVIARAHEAAHVPSFEKPVFILMLGGDARSGNPSRVRMDAIQIVALDAKAQRAAIVGVPRDSYVEIPGRGLAKINSAGAFGGPELMIQTVERLTGCRFSYYTLTSFAGFRAVVDEFGGIPFDVRSAITDPFADLNVKRGNQRFGGAEALGWARSRKSRPRGDLDRSAAQADLMIAALKEARADYATDVSTPFRALGAMRRNLQMKIPLAEALRLGLAALRLDPANVTTRVVDAEIDSVAGQSIVRITEEGKRQFTDVCTDGRLDG